MSGFTCGRYGPQTLEEIGERAATRILQITGNRAVCISASGHVTVEQLDAAMDEDIVGVYEGQSLRPNQSARDFNFHFVEVARTTLLANVFSELSELAHQQRAAVLGKSLGRQISRDLGVAAKERGIRPRNTVKQRVPPRRAA